MKRIQIIEQDGKPAFAVVPIDLWERICEAVEDAQDIAVLEKFDREDDGFRFPYEVVRALSNGEHPVRAWREHRGFTQDQLSAKAGISKPYLSQIESGKRAGTVATLRRIARVLAVPIDALVAERHE